jgi:hypothetical protein
MQTKVFALRLWRKGTRRNPELMRSAIDPPRGQCGYYRHAGMKLRSEHSSMLAIASHKPASLRLRRQRTRVPSLDV